MHMNHSLRHAQRGVGLIEVLIAVLVLSFGMLGMIGLQTWSLRANQSALERGMATAQAYSIIDTLRADRIAASNGVYDIGLGDDTPELTEAEKDAGVSLPPPDAALALWREEVKGSLNDSATSSVDCNGFTCEVIIRWNDSRGELSAESEVVEAAEQQELVTQVRL